MFWKAVGTGDHATASAILERDSGLVHEIDRYSDTALNLAIERFDLEMIKVLTEAGSDLNHDGGRTGIPLVYAAYFGDHNLEIVEYLLDLGADPNIQSIHKWTHGNGTPLHNAAMHAQVETIRLLIERGANVNEPNRLSPRMPYIIQNALSPEPPATEKRREILRLLLDAGADPTVRTTVFSPGGESLTELSRRWHNGLNLLEDLNVPNTDRGQEKETEPVSHQTH